MITLKGDEKNFPIKLTENTELNYQNKRREKNEKIEEDKMLYQPTKKKIKSYAENNDKITSYRNNNELVFTLNK